MPQQIDRDGVIALPERLNVARVCFGVTADAVNENQLGCILLADLDGPCPELAATVADLSAEQIEQDRIHRGTLSV